MADFFDVRGVSKQFDDVKALNGVTLKAAEGTVFALLGPNGAGKTTLIRILSTLLVPDKGSVKVLGIDALSEPQAVRETIGLAGQSAAVDEYLTGYENIYMTGRLYHLPKAEAKKRTQELLNRLNIAKAANRQVRTYSGGMRRRLDLGASLVGRPKVLFLDEPTTGLDPRTRLDLWEIIRELIREGTSILLTTQYLEEADELADRIAVMNLGKIIAEGTSDKLKSQLGGDVVEVEIASSQDKAKALAAIHKVAKDSPTIDSNGTRFTIPVHNGTKGLLGAVQALNETRVEVTSVALHRPSLDDVFLKLTGEHTPASKIKPNKKRRGGQK